MSDSNKNTTRMINISYDRINQISNGSAEFPIRMIELYLEDFSTYLEQFIDAWTGQDANEVRRMAHKMRSPAGTIEVSEISTLLERAEGIDTIASTDTLCDDLGAAYQLVELQLVKKLNDLKKNNG